MTSVSTIGEDCRVTVTSRASQRNGATREPMAAPNSSAKASVARSAPAIRISEFSTPSWNIDQAGAVFSIGSDSSMSA